MHSGFQNFSYRERGVYTIFFACAQSENSSSRYNVEVLYHSFDIGLISDLIYKNIKYIIHMYTLDGIILLRILKITV